MRPRLVLIVLALMGWSWVERPAARQLTIPDEWKRVTDREVRLGDNLTLHVTNLDRAQRLAMPEKGGS